MQYDEMNGFAQWLVVTSMGEGDASDSIIEAGPPYDWHITLNGHEMDINAVSKAIKEQFDYQVQQRALDALRQIDSFIKELQRIHDETGDMVKDYVPLAKEPPEED